MRSRGGAARLRGGRAAAASLLQQGNTSRDHRENNGQKATTIRRGNQRVRAPPSTRIHVSRCTLAKGSSCAFFQRFAWLSVSPDSPLSAHVESRPDAARLRGVAMEIDGEDFERVSQHGAVEDDVTRLQVDTQLQ